MNPCVRCHLLLRLVYEFCNSEAKGSLLFYSTVNSLFPCILFMDRNDHIFRIAFKKQSINYNKSLGRTVFYIFKV